jgi:hypothetical protein
MAEQRLEDRSEQVTLAQAEAEFQLNLELIGMAREEFRAMVEAGKIPDPTDIKAITKALSEAWSQAQSERNRVAEQNRKNGIAGAGELDLAAARAEVCERLDRIAAALAAG